jgi:hypothetical protein
MFPLWLPAWLAIPLERMGRLATILTARPSQHFQQSTHLRVVING